MVKKKFETSSKTFDLRPESIDALAADVERTLSSFSMERANVLRIRLSMEEALLSWQDRFGIDQEVIYSVKKQLGKAKEKQKDIQNGRQKAAAKGKGRQPSRQKKVRVRSR